MKEYRMMFLHSYEWTCFYKACSCTIHVVMYMHMLCTSMLIRVKGHRMMFLYSYEGISCPLLSWTCLYKGCSCTIHVVMYMNMLCRSMFIRIKEYHAIFLIFIRMKEYRMMFLYSYEGTSCDVPLLLEEE